MVLWMLSSISIPKMWGAFLLFCLWQQVINLEMTHIYYEKRSLHCSILKYPISLFFVVVIISACLSLHPPPLSLPSSLQVLADSQRPAVIYACMRTHWRNHVAWRCLLSNATNQAHSEVNWHGRSCDGCQPIRHYWFIWIAPHLREGREGGRGLSMCQLPTSQPQITSAGQALGI